MVNEATKSVEKKLSDPTLSVRLTSENQRSDVSGGSGSTLSLLKSEVARMSHASRNAVSDISAEVARRPLTYTLAAAGAGAILGLGVMAMMRRPVRP